jgi:outer membrane immunogenic protein
VKKRLALGFVALGVASLGVLPCASFAADRPVLAPLPYQPVPFVPRQVVDWTGINFGANVGYGWGHASTTTTFFNNGGGTQFAGGTTTPFGLGATELAGKGITGGGGVSGPLAGAQVGFMWQANWLVFGAELDAQWMGQRGSFASGCTARGCFASDAVKVKSLLTGRARLGIAFDWILPYVTAGAALGSVSDDLTVTIGGVTGSFMTQGGSRLGWTAGFGADFALTSNWSARIEYLYVSLEDIGTTTRIPNELGLGDTLKGIDVKENILRVGLNYRFGPMGGPGILERQRLAPAGFASTYDFLPTVTTYRDRPTFSERAPDAKPAPAATMIAGSAPQRDAPAATASGAARGTGAAPAMLAGEVPTREAPIAVARAADPAAAAEPAPAPSASERKRAAQPVKNFADIEDDDGSVGLAPVATGAITLPTLNKRSSGGDDGTRLKRIMSICSGC